MISKEFISNIFGVNVSHINMNGNYIEIWEDGGKFSNGINIYELAHMCKEWGDRIGYTIVSYISDGSGWSDLKYERNFKQVHDLSIFRSDTEPEAIFKACQWILDNKEQK